MHVLLVPLQGLKKKTHIRLKNLSQYIVLESLCIPYDKFFGGEGCENSI
jgi:hypothetical protein